MSAPARAHGRALIVLEGDELDRRGMVVDFAEIKRSIRAWIDKELDHRMILNKRDPVLSFLQEQDELLTVMPDKPTAENIARLIFDYAKSQGFPVAEVSLWETPSSCATYREQPAG